MIKLSSTTPKPSLTPDQRRVQALMRFAISITVLTVVGHLVLGFETSWAQLLVTALCCYGFELIFEMIDARLGRRPVRFRGDWRTSAIFFLPAHIAAFSISLLIYPGQHLSICVVAAALAVGSKYVFKAPVNGRSRHFMNPSNFAIAVVLTAYPQVGPAPSYMFTEYLTGFWDAFVPVVLLGFGLMLNIKLTRKGPLIAAWAAGFAAQALIKGLLFPDTFSVLAGLSVMTGATFVLFTNYMITDPGSTPFARRGQIGFGLTAAAAYGLVSGLGITYGLFYCVIIACLLRGVLLWIVAWRQRADAARVSAVSAQAPSVPAQPALSPVAFSAAKTTEQS